MADASTPNDPNTKDECSADEGNAAENKSNNPKSITESSDAHTPPRNKADSNGTKKKSDQRRETTLKVIPIIISFVALSVSFGSCYSANRSANTAESVFRITQSNERPWVSAGPRLTQPVIFDKKGNLGLSIDLDVKNVGRAVALDVISWVEMAILDPDGDDVTARTRQWQKCADLRYLPYSPQDIPGMVLFPGVDAIRLSANVGEWAKDIKPELARALPPNKGKVGFAIIGCLSYRAASEDISSILHCNASPMGILLTKNNALSRRKEASATWELLENMLPVSFIRYPFRPSVQLL